MNLFPDHDAAADPVAPRPCDRCRAAPCTCQTCPLCGRPFAKLNGSMPAQGLLALGCANMTPTVQRAVSRLGLEDGESLRCCITCSRAGRSGTKLVARLYHDRPQLQPTSTRAKPKVVETVLKTSGGQPAVSVSARVWWIALPLTVSYPSVTPLRTPRPIQILNLKKFEIDPNYTGNPELLPKPPPGPTFKQNAEVWVTQATTKGILRVGGAARVLDMRTTPDGREMYDVKYVLGGGGEKDVDVSALKPLVNGAAGGGGGASAPPHSQSRGQNGRGPVCRWASNQRRRWSRCDESYLRKRSSTGSN